MTVAEPSRAEDDAVERVLTLTKAGWSLDDIASDADRSVVWVIETLYSHRECFDDVEADPAPLH